ncbi:MAG: 23S rRNA (adenine(2030)-N(6))-methyltransferase RlmJ [Alphaproteobacteria bacterium]|nr:23S rRNA (adenine(2030)-N(6))-methyltransferase RlmJ [Alphaproteobacteria bacterium]
MNYRHAFHAGNFADVLKHVVLTRAIVYLKKKSAPFRVVDTHAGVSVYDLTNEAATKTGEWRNGIGRLIDAKFAPDVIALLAPYLQAVATENPPAELIRYPGSPKLVAHLLRADDRLIANELHPEDHKALRREFVRSTQVKVMRQDGWRVLKAVLPPKERRGITIVDPPFEAAGEFDRLVQSIRDHHQRFETGTLILWYPIKDCKRVAKFHNQIKDLKVNRCLVCELKIDAFDVGGPVKATGLVVINPPYALFDELQMLLPVLCTTLGRSAAANYELCWLSGERN